MFMAVLRIRFVRTFDQLPFSERKDTGFYYIT
jgi:hypothetical protein